MQSVEMTPRQWLELAAAQPLWIGGYLAALPVLALLLGLLHQRGAGNQSPWKFPYAGLVYAACIPGMLGATVTLYLILFVRQNLLDVNMLVTLLPVASMAATLFIAGRNVDFGPLPGFGRLSGLMTVLGLTFAVLFALSRTAIWIVFGGSVLWLGLIGAFVFALLKWGGYMAFRRRDEPERPPPAFGG